MRAKPECKAAICEVFPGVDAGVCCMDGETTIQIEGGVRLTFDMLHALSLAFGTKLINIVYSEGRYYSERTGSDPDEFSIEIQACVKAR